MRFAGLVGLLATLSIGVALIVLLQFRMPTLAGSVQEQKPEASVVTAPAEPTKSARSGLGIERVGDAEEAVRAILRERFGVTCYDSSDITYGVLPGAAEQLDKKIDKANLTAEGWVEEGLWLGSKAQAAEAFGASEAFSDPEETWMLVTTNERPIGRQLKPAESKSGEIVWSMSNMVGECVSTDPAYDEKASPNTP